MHITSSNVNTMLSELMWKFKYSARHQSSRNGTTWAMEEPVIMTYLMPRERVLFSTVRDANPIFHLMESLWILAGRRDVGFLDLFNKSLKQYSDDGETYNAAYGYRIRHHFNQDQLVNVINTLRSYPDTRQAVLQIWETNDLIVDTVDKACNMSVVFRINSGYLDITVFNRSNDLWWGACGANAVQFSMLQEFVAAALGLGVGHYHQISNNLHLYQDLYGDKVNVEQLMESPFLLENENYYVGSGGLEIFPLVGDMPWQNLLVELELFCDDPYAAHDYESEFIRRVAVPMAMVQKHRRTGKSDGRSWARSIEAKDWQLAVLQWIDRREEAKNAASN